MNEKLPFEPCNYGDDFECVWFWPKGWPHDIKDNMGCTWYVEPDVWFKAYDTSLKENGDDAMLFERGYLFNCKVSIRYFTITEYSDRHSEEEWIAKFPAKDRADAERLLQIAADALYGSDGYDETA